MKISMIKGLRRATICAVVVVVALATIAFSRSDDHDFAFVKNFDIYQTLMRELELYYVDPIDAGDLITTSINEMLQTLDPYTVYIPEDDIEDFRTMTTGKYGGIGAIIRSEKDQVIIVEPYKGFPADKAGLRAGDIILEIDGKAVGKYKVNDVSELLKGDPKTSVQLTIKTPFTDKIRKVNVVRDNVKINSVGYAGLVADSIGYISLSNFTENCAQEVKAELLRLKREHNIKALVFDLRGNPGGLLSEAINVSNLFVEKGQEIVSTKGKMQQWNKTYTALNDPTDTQIPLVVLVNSGSASASEIVSGVIQDLDRGVIVGTRTYGKGLVQTTRDLSYQTKLKLTTAKYYIPSGRCIQALDYSHRNEDGSVGKVPDSLISKFNTRVGREVFDGGGVLPDVEVELKSLSIIATSLYAKHLLFDYATYYRQHHDTIGNPRTFKISDETYDDFKKFLSDKNYDYTLDSERALNHLESVLKKEKYDDQTVEELQSLRNKLAHDKNKDLETFKNEIVQLLSSEIACRYYYQDGRTISAFADDITLDKAIEILNNKEEYKRILSAPEKEQPTK